MTHHCLPVPAPMSAPGRPSRGADLAELWRAADAGAFVDQRVEPVFHASRCEGLWSAVLLQLWEDSFLPPAAHGPTAMPGYSARRWFGSEGFGEVCALAGFDAAALLQRWRARQAEWAAAGHPAQAGLRAQTPKNKRKRAKQEGQP